MQLDSCVKIPNHVRSQVLDGELVMLDLHNGVYYGLDPVGTSAWEMIRGQPGIPLQVVLEFLVESYDVTPDRCRDDLLHLIMDLHQNGLIEVCSETAS